MTNSTADAQTDAAASVTLHTLLGDLVTAAHRLTRLAAQATERTESPAAWRTIAVLQAMGPMRLGELARQSRVTQPTMTKIIRGLDDLDWVKRIVDSDDARASLIASTPKGERALGEWRDDLSTALLPYFDDLPGDDIEVLRRAVGILTDRAGRGAGRSDGEARK
ncbi:DNA-binding MarR family transcriptional regulator [Mycetocola sp. CAN_C7]|uniref:MarR family winged helix-turn-helix transcriptional regulator n=1 Tax=Mycetocola sp. CAN_C7 TaxID=2787724 RepID=UPI0018CA92CF